MSTEKATGFEYNTLLELDTYSGGNVTISTTSPRTGAHCLRFNDGGNFNYVAGWDLTPRDEYYMQLPVRPLAVSAGAQFVRWKSGATILGGLKSVNGVIEAYTGNFVTKVGTSDQALSISIWQVLQIYLKIADSGGRLVVKVGSETWIDFTGDTKPGAEGTINRLEICAFSGGTQTYYDDVVFNNVLGTRNNSWPNGIPIYVVRPNGPGNYAQWTPSAGANWECVDEKPPSPTDYVYVNSTGQKDSYAMAACPGEVKLISGVIADYWGQAVGSPAVTQIKRLIRLSSVDYEGAGITVEPSFKKHTDVIELNPATSQPWTPAEIDALEQGMTSLT